nr:glycerate kinase [Actinomyces wuliandei]
MTALEAAQAMAAGVHDANPQATCLLRPMADGGEGFAETLAVPLGAPREVLVHDARGRPARGALYLAGATTPTALLDVATAAGLEQVAPPHRDIMRSNSLGVGELVLAALDHGAREIVVGLGGSATNDGGAGMLTALGVRLLDEHGLDPVPEHLVRVASVDASGLDPRLEEVTVQAACDVSSPLLGPRGPARCSAPRRARPASRWRCWTASCPAWSP